jgi:hypothetical protein
MVLLMIILTRTSARIPKLVQIVLASQDSIQKSAVVWVRRSASGASKFLGWAVHLQISEHLMITYYVTTLLGAPPLDDAR